jgi:ferredoxin
MGLVFCADNVQKNVRFICHCCKCCCRPLLGISKFGYPNSVVTSNYIAVIDADLCAGCGKCSQACPIETIEMLDTKEPRDVKKQKASVDKSICIGCGVCALKCPTKACKLEKRASRVIHPETTFERIMLSCLEKGTLQNQIFADPQSINDKFMRPFVGAFLKLSPVKKALMSDKLRSRFLATMKQGVARQGKAWMANI